MKTPLTIDSSTLAYWRGRILQDCAYDDVKHAVMDAIFDLAARQLATTPGLLPPQVGEGGRRPDEGHDADTP